VKGGQFSTGINKTDQFNVKCGDLTSDFPCEIIGEAVKHLPSEFRERYSKIPWKEIAGMRDKLIHEYFGINYRIYRKQRPVPLKIEHPKARGIIKLLYIEDRQNPKFHVKR